jgi:hypothetical protein
MKSTDGHVPVKLEDPAVFQGGAREALGAQARSLSLRGHA